MIGYIDNILYIPNKELKLIHNGGQTIIKGNKYTFNDTALIWLEQYNNTNSNKDLSLITNPILLGPTRLQFNKFIELTIKLPERKDLDYSSIYKYNEKTEQWSYIPSIIDKKEIIRCFYFLICIGMIVRHSEYYFFGPEYFRRFGLKFV